MTDGHIRTSTAADGGFDIVIDRPDAGNALTADMTTALAAALANLPDAAKFVVLSGQGADFCAGRASPMPPAGTVVTAAQIRARVADPVLDFYAAVRNVSVPVIAVVKGRAHGVGCALAGLADLTIADTTAAFAIPEMDRDIPPLLVMTALSARLSRAALARMVFSRQPVNAEEAQAIGLVAQACAPDDIETVVGQYRQRLASNGRTSLTAVKHFLNVAPEMSFAALKDYAAASNSSAVSERFVKPA
jgi:enoyl-CoA hydratase/carnithine racemase